jgi:APA family basic amino acid/polyamine antiporter
MTNDKGAQLRRDIGFFGAAFLVLNAMIGAGIFALPGKVAVNAGLLSPWLFLVVGVVFLAVVLTFAELASYFRDSGGPVLYATYAFGPLAGFGTGWILFLSRMTAFAANANVMAIYLGSLFPWFGAGVGRAARPKGFFTVLKVLPLILLVLVGLQHVTTGTLIPSASEVIGDLGGTTLLLIYAYVGFETMAVTAGETAEPRRVLPRALVRTVVGTGILYFLIVLVFISEDAYADATLVDVGRMLAGPAGAIAITLAAVFSIGGNLASSMIAAPRLIFALAENRLLPAWFGNVHPKYATPDHSILVMGGLALVMALTGSFVELAVASSLSRLLSYILSIASLPIIRNRASDAMKARAYRIRGGYLVPIVGLAICLWLTAQANAQNWQTVGILLAIGLVLYAIERHFLRR